MKKNNYKKYLAGAIIFLSVFMILGVSFARAQDDGGPPPIDSPVVSGPSGGPSSPASGGSGGSPTTSTGGSGTTGATGAGGTTGSTANPSTVKSLNWVACGVNLFSCSIYGISYVINLVANVLVSLGAVLVTLGLYLDSQVFNSATVQAGFSVSLAIANLGFVLGIIVIALATILRNETYGIKQMLWKLVVMAILVNFGLVICGPIVGLSDSFTNYFLNASGGASGFVNSLGNAFAPQKLFIAPPGPTPAEQQYAAECPQVDFSNAGDGILTPPPSQNVQAQCIALQQKIDQQQANADTTGAGGFTQAVLSMVFSFAFLLITALTFITIGILLVVRYVYLAILLILLPLAWLMWIFPKFNHHFAEWWSLFIKWTFFPAISIFFVYLAFQSVQVASGVSTVPAANIFQASGSNTNAVGGLAYQLGSGAVGIIQTALDELLMCGLCLGGLFAANSLTNKGADSVIHGGKWAAGKVGGYAWNKGKRIAGDRLRTNGLKYDAETKETTSRAQRLAGKFQGIPVLRKGAAAVANYTAPKAVHEERKDDIKHYIDSELKNLDNDGLLKRATSNKFINPTVSASIAQELAKRNLTDKLDPNDPKKNDEILGKYVDAAESMGNLEAITNNRPDLMPPREKPASEGGGMETQEEATARAIKSAKGEIIHAKPDVFSVRSAVLALSSNQLSAIGSDNGDKTPERKEKITIAIKDIVNNFNLKKEIMKEEGIFEKGPGGNQPKLDPKTGLQMKHLVGTGKYELDQKALADAIKNNPTIKGLNKVGELVKHMEASSTWANVLN